jgi:hypothetical protein
VVVKRVDWCAWWRGVQGVGGEDEAVSWLVLNAVV